MPATTDYWVNDANAEPLMFVTASANDGVLALMDTVTGVNYSFHPTTIRIPGN